MEKKSNKAKEAKMVSGNQEKLSYEDLEKVAQNLNQQCKEMYQKLCEAEQIIGNFNDVGLLLSILDKAEYFDDKFIERCSGKIQETIVKMLDSVEKTEEN